MAVSSAARTKPSTRERGRRRISGIQGAAAIARAGIAGSTYTPRLPELRLKNSTTSTVQHSSTATNVSRSRSARRQRGHSHGTSAISGSHSNGITLTK